MNIPIQVSPATNDLTLSMDQTLAEEVKVTIPKSGIVPKVDAYFLADTTSSMSDAINTVKNGISDVLTQIGGLGADVQFGVGEYKDFPAPDEDNPNYHRYAFAHQHSLSANTAEIQAAVTSWTVTPGRDVPEAQFYALDQLAEPPGGTIGWRADSRRIIVWFGDAPGHDAVCQQISGLSYDITEASVTAKLVGQKIKVLVLSLRSSGAPQGLDDNPQMTPNGYESFCGAPGGTVEQGTRIAKTTGGKIVKGVSANTIVETIINELAAQITEIGNVSLVASGDTAQFVSAIAPTDGYDSLSRDQDHEISFDVSWLGTVAATYEDQVFSGSLDVVADGEVIGGKTVRITVPLDEEIPVPRPDDVSGTWMLIHQVTSNYLVPYGYAATTVGRRVVMWYLDPPHTGSGQVHLWVLVKQTDDTYLIHTFEKNATGEPLYLQAPDPPGHDEYSTLQERGKTDKTKELQSWVLVPVSRDPNTYAIRPKSFPEYAIGTWRNRLITNEGVITSCTWGEPTLNHYWRLSKPPADVQ